MNFACTEITLNQILKCSFGLNKTENKVFIFLIKKNEFFSVKKISVFCKLSQSSVQKALNNLDKKGLISRKKINTRPGGYHYIYNINDKINIKKILNSKLKGWFYNVKKELEEL